MRAGPPWYFWVSICLLGALPRVFDLIHFTSLENRDFGIFYAAGRLAWNSPASVYDPISLGRFSRQILGLDLGLSFPYPPHSLFLFAPLASLPFAIAFALWSLGGLAFFTWAAKPHIGRVPSWLPIFLPATLVCLTYGQTGLVVGALWLLAFRDQSWALAALTIKPQIGFLGMFQSPRLLAPAVIAGAAIFLFSVLVFGGAAWTNWCGLIMAQAKTSVSFMDAKFSAPMLAYGVPGQIAFALAAVALVSRKFNVFTGATATLLISPYSYHYDMTVACLGFAVAMADDRPAYQIAIAAVAFLTPALITFGSWIAPPLLLSGLWVQTRYASLRKRGDASVGAAKTAVADPIITSFRMPFE